MQFPRNLSRDERRAFLDELNIEHVVYTRRQAFEEQIYEIPSRAFAMDVFERYFRSRRSVLPTSWHRGQHFIWEKNVTTNHMVATVRAWASNHHSRFKFQIQRSYLLYKFDTTKPGAGRVWRIHYPSLNTKMPIPGETRGGWCAVHDGVSMDRTMTYLRNADVWAHVKVESTVWSLPARPFLCYCVVIQELSGDRMGAKLTLPELYTQGKWGVDAQTMVPHNMCFFSAYGLWKNDKTKHCKVRKIACKTFLDFYGLELKAPKKVNWKAIATKYPGIRHDELERFERKFHLSIWIYELIRKGDRTLPHLLRPGCPNHQIMRLAQCTTKEGAHLMLIKNPSQFAKCYPCPRCGCVKITEKVLHRHLKSCNNLCREICYPKIKERDGVLMEPWYTYDNNSRLRVRESFGKYPSFLCWDFECFMPVLPRCANKNQKYEVTAEHYLASVGISCLEPKSQNILSSVLTRRETETELQFLERFMKKMLEFHKMCVQPIYQEHQQKLKATRDEYLKKKQALRNFKGSKESKMYNIFNSAMNKSRDKYMTYLNWIFEVPALGFNSQKYDMVMLKQFLPRLHDNLRQHIADIIGVSHRESDFNWDKTIDNYRKQDLKAGRTITDDYITQQSLELLENATRKVLGGLKCIYCKTTLQKEHRNQPNGWTCERVLDSECHSRSNCVLACLSCNRSRLNRKLYCKVVTEVLSGTRKLSVVEDLCEEVDSNLEISAVKCNNKIRLVFSKLFKFQDVLNLVSPCNLRSFIGSWNPGGLQKGYFCYEWLQDLSLLNQDHLPPREDFYSQLRQENEVTPEIYAWLQETWKEKGMKTMRDFLGWYNNLDTEPFAKAILNMGNHYKKNYNVDLIKNFASISSFSLWYSVGTAMKWKPKARVFSLIMEKDKDLFVKFQNAMVGGYSGPLDRRHGCIGKTLLSGAPIRSVKGWDYTAMYLSCIGGEMPTGLYQRRRLNHVDTPKLPKDLSVIVGEYCEQVIIWPWVNYNYQPILDNILSGVLYGFVIVDIHTPEHLKSTFRGLRPLFKRAKILPTEANVGPVTWKLYKESGEQRQPSTKLINSYYAKHILLSTNYIKWLLGRGLVITRIYEWVTFESGRKPFQEFMDTMCSERRKGDVLIDGQKPFKLLGDTAKTISVSCYGKLLERTEKHKRTFYTNKARNDYEMEAPDWVESECLGEDAFQVTRLKRKIMKNRPIYLGIQVYLNAKLLMLTFVEWIDSLVDHRLLEWGYTDTDAAYAYLGKDTLEECILPENMERYLAEKHKWFPKIGDQIHSQVKVHGQLYDISERTFFNRTAGLLKEEFSGTGMAVLNSKSVFCWGAKKKPEHKDFMKREGCKASMKGQQKDRFYKEQGMETENIKKCFEDIIFQKKDGDGNLITKKEGNNMGFRLLKKDEEHRMGTYNLRKTALNYWYDKSIINSDLVTLSPTPL